MTDFTSHLRQLEVTNIIWGIYPLRAIKLILFQTVAVSFQEKQLEIQIPFYQKDFDPAGKLREGRCKWKFPELWTLRFKFFPWVLRMGMFVKFILKVLHMNWNQDPLLTIYLLFCVRFYERIFLSNRKVGSSELEKQNPVVILKCWNEMIKFTGWLQLHLLTQLSNEALTSFFYGLSWRKGTIT